MKLTFHQGAFALIDKNKSTSLPLKAAIQFKPFADKRAKRVFDRVLVKRFKCPAESPPSFLDPHQIEGVLWVLSRSRSYLAHAPGAGKTAVAIVASLLSGPGQAVFIVPPDLCTNWVREILKWTAWRNIWPSIYVIGRTKEKDNSDWGADFIVCPDSMLTKDWVYEGLEALRPKLLAVDEASRFKEVTAERTKALFGGLHEKRVYYGLVQNAKHSVLMDGSPMPNRPIELWAPVTGMATETIDFLDYHEFGIKYCGAHFKTDGFKNEWDYSGASNQELLKKKLQKEFMHVVPEEALSHPERRRSLLFIDDVRTMQMKAWERDNLPKLKLDDLDEDQSLGELAERRQEIGLRKVPQIVSYVRGRLEHKNESVLVFAWHREVCRQIAIGLGAFRPGLVQGGTKPEQRELIFRRFQSGACRVIVGNISAMGRGHNLQRADRVVFGEYSWTDELNKQCEKRASRKGSDKAFVRCDYIVASGSMDESVLKSVFTKAHNVKRVIG